MSMIAASIYESALNSVLAPNTDILGIPEYAVVFAFAGPRLHLEFLDADQTTFGTFLLLVAAALDFKFPDVIDAAEEGDAFTLQDPELHDLVNLAVDMNSGLANHDTAMLFMERLKSVEARLKITAKVAA